MNTKTAAASAAYIASITTANLLVAKYGPVVVIANAFVFIGFDLAIRDYLHDAWNANRKRLAGLIAVAGIVSYALNPATGIIAVASTVAFSTAAVVDWFVYYSLRGRAWQKRSNASNAAGAVVDSVLFPAIAFGSMLPAIVIGQIAAKIFGGAVWTMLIAKSRKP